MQTQFGPLLLPYHACNRRNTACIDLCETFSNGGLASSSTPQIPIDRLEVVGCGLTHSGLTLSALGIAAPKAQEQQSVTCDCSMSGDALSVVT